MTDAEGLREWRFEQWDGTFLVVSVDESDPGDIGEPRTLIDYEDGPTHYLSVAALRSSESATPDRADR